VSEATYCLDDLPARLRAKIAVHPSSGCWIGQWKPVAKGYVRIWWEGKPRFLHRVVYQLLVEPIPDDLGLDHVKAAGCISNACCWPAHLEPVTSGVNTRRSPRTRASINAAKQVCPAGHELVPGNLAPWRLPARICLTCARGSSREAQRATRAHRPAERAALLARQAEAVHRMHAEGASNAAIGRALGISRHSVPDILAGRDRRKGIR
jgi:hypothetical protein